VAPRVQEESVHPLLCSGARVRPLNFTVRQPTQPTTVSSALYRRIIFALRLTRALCGKKHMHDGIAIRGDDAFVRATVGALELLKAKTPDVYALLQKHIADVVSAKRSGVLTRALRYIPKTLVLFGPSYSGNSTVEYAGALAHEAYHCELYRRAQVDSPNLSVPASAYSGEYAETLCLNYQCDVLRRLGLDQARIEQYESTLKSKWWQIPFHQKD
jgi:hypothetical protein